MAKIASLVPATTVGSTPVKDVVANHVSILTQIRAYAVGVEQTNLQAAITPPPDWFKTLSANLGVAQKHATVWTTSLEGDITSTIPQAVLTISSRFKTGTDSILSILNASGNNPSSAQVTEIVDTLTWIFRHVGDEQTSINAVKSTFMTFQTNAGIDLTALTTGNNSIQKALLDDQKVVNKLNSDIAIQNADITKDNAAIEAAAIAAGIGLFVGVAVLGIGAASTGPFAPIAMIIGGLIMVGAIIEAAAVIAVYSQKLAEAQNQLANDTDELNNEQQQIAALTLMNQSVTSLVNLNKNMAQSLTDLADWFALVTTKIGTVVSDLNDAQGDMNTQDWLDFSLDIQQAQQDWNDFQNFATGWQTTVTTLQNKIITVTKSGVSMVEAHSYAM